MCSARRARLTRSLRRVKIRIPPVLRMRARLMVARLFQMRFLGRAGRKPGGFLGFDIAEGAVFLGVGHWLHDTPPICSDNACFSNPFPSRKPGKTFHEITPAMTPPRQWAGAPNGTDEQPPCDPRHIAPVHRHFYKNK